MNKRVLIVDDHPIIRIALRKIIKRIDSVEVADEAANGFETLKFLKQDTYDLLILNIDMPGIDGFEVLMQAGELELQPHVLIFSSYLGQHFASRCVKLGALGYIDKASATEAEIITAICRVAEGEQYFPAAIYEQLVDASFRGCSSPAHETLSKREYQVFYGIIRGKELRDIASELHVSSKTISTYKTRILGKMKMRSSVELTRYALKHKLCM